MRSTWALGLWISLFMLGCGGADRARKALETDAGAGGSSGGGTGGAATGGAATGGAATGGAATGGAATGGASGGDAGGALDASSGDASRNALDASLDAASDADVSSPDAASPPDDASVTGLVDAPCVPDVTPAALVAYWPAEGDFIDVQGAHDGTNQSGVTFVPGRVGQAFHFAADSSQYVGVAYSPSLDLPTFTVSAWVSRAGADPTNWGTILSKEDHSRGDPWNDRNYGVFVNRGDVCAAGIVSSSYTGGNVCSTTSVADGAWHHVAATFDGCTARVYVDGALQASALAPAPPTGSQQDLWIGSWASLNGGEDLDEVRLYRGALDPAGVAALASVNPG